MAPFFCTWFSGKWFLIELMKFPFLSEETYKDNADFIKKTKEIVIEKVCDIQL